MILIHSVGSMIKLCTMYYVKYYYDVFMFGLFIFVCVSSNSCLLFYGAGGNASLQTDRSYSERYENQSAIKKNQIFEKEMKHLKWLVIYRIYNLEVFLLLSEWKEHTWYLPKIQVLVLWKLRLSFLSKNSLFEFRNKPKKPSILFVITQWISFEICLCFVAYLETCISCIETELWRV